MSILDLIFWLVTGKEKIVIKLFEKMEIIPIIPLHLGKDRNREFKSQTLLLIFLYAFFTEVKLPFIVGGYCIRMFLPEMPWLGASFPSLCGIYLSWMSYLKEYGITYGKDSGRREAEDRKPANPG